MQTILIGVGVTLCFVGGCYSVWIALSSLQSRSWNPKPPSIRMPLGVAAMSGSVISGVLLRNVAPTLAVIFQFLLLAAAAYCLLLPPRDGRS